MNKTLYCKKLNKQIKLSDCSNCKYKEYKQVKEYKYKPKKGKCNRYYNDNSIMPKSILYSNNKIKGYEKHHIFGGVANRPKSEEYGLFIWLNQEQHRYLHDNPKEMLKLKKLAQITCMQVNNISTDEFIKIFGKSWI